MHMEDSPAADTAAFLGSVLCLLVGIAQSKTLLKQWLNAGPVRGQAMGTFLQGSENSLSRFLHHVHKSMGWNPNPNLF